MSGFMTIVAALGIAARFERLNQFGFSAIETCAPHMPTQEQVQRFLVLAEAVEPYLVATIVIVRTCVTRRLCGEPENFGNQSPDAVAKIASLTDPQDLRFGVRTVNPRLLAHDVYTAPFGRA